MSRTSGARLTIPTEATLRRGLLARLRTIRVYEFVSWVAIAALVYGVFSSLNLGLVLFGAFGLFVRLAIATEWVRCDSSGVSWRSLFVTHNVPWLEITSIELVARGMFLRFTRANYPAMSPCLAIERRAGSVPMYINPSVWVSVVRQGEFIAAARLISPTDWTVSNDSGASEGHHPSGKRVGRPTRRDPSS